jgi:hypothetical protein
MNLNCSRSPKPVTGTNSNIIFGSVSSFRFVMEEIALEDVSVCFLLGMDIHKTDVSVQAVVLTSCYLQFDVHAAIPA